MTAKAIKTRFRAYQLATAGSSFSYCSNTNFTLFEARYSEENEKSISDELQICGLEAVNTLHITSWDQDHCSPNQLEAIIKKFKPTKIEYPGYAPDTDCGRESLAIIMANKAVPNRKLVSITPEYIASLEDASSFSYKNIYYHPKMIDPDCANNNSTISQFRTGAFNLLSLGDVESENIAAYLRRLNSVNQEVDILMMAHHGADNGFTTSSFIKKVRPTLAIATSNYQNHFDHPKPEIRELLHKNEVRLFTTKTGDVIVHSIGNHTGDYEVINLKANSTEVSSRYVGSAKKRKFLGHNDDALRNRITTHYRGPK